MSDSKNFFGSIDRSGFTIAGYQKRVNKPWGHELHLAPEGEPYMMKIIHINEGCRLSLQVHDAKSETWTVMKGKAGVIIEDAEGKLQQIELEPGKGYTSKVGQKHRLIGLSDCDILEASTPEIGTTWRLEDDYSRPDETEELRARPDRGWKS